MSALGDFPGGPVLLMQRVQVPPLVEKLSSYKLHGQKKKKKVNSQGEYSQPSVSSGSTDLTNKG